MGDEDTKGRPSLQQLIGSLPKTPVDVVEPAMVVGEVRLGDGTILKVRVIIQGALRVEGLRDEAGQPVYQVASLVIPTVTKSGAQ